MGIINRRFWLFVFSSLCACTSIIYGQIRIVDFDKASFENGIVHDKSANWITFFSTLSSNEIDGTPSLVIEHRPAAPFGSTESGYFAGGCKYLSFDFKRLNGGNCELIVWVNDKVVTTIDQTNGATQSVIKLPVFISGPIKFKFEHRGEKSGSIAIDNILWTPCTKEDAIIYEKKHVVLPPKGNLIFEGDFERGNLDNFSLAGNLKNRLVTMPVRMVSMLRFIQL